MAFTVPTATEFKTYFMRDFPFGGTGGNLQQVQDSDIDKAIAEAGFNFNPALFDTQANFTIAYLYLTAHYLVTDLRAASQGIAGQYSWMQTAKSAGGVSESFQIPQQILDHPYLSMLSKTNYGAKYLSLMLPMLVGQIFTVEGQTQP